MDCPVCGEPNMMFYPGEEYEEDGEVFTEPDVYACPRCGNEEVI